MNLVFLDLETTGLDPMRDMILETGIVIVNPSDLSVVTSKNWVSHFDPNFSRALWSRVSLKVRQMHVDNGLWKECLESDRESYRYIAEEAAAFIRENDGWGSYLCGNSVHFDRSFLQANPSGGAILEGLHSHRHLDISSLNVISEIWPALLVNAGKGEAHRAIEDCLDSIRQLTFYLTQVDYRDDLPV